MSARLWIGAQGWLYKDWLGAFYPPGTDERSMLAEYGRIFSTVEVDSTFYATPAPATFEGWRRRSPDGFRFSLKVPQEITHVHRFRDAGPPFAEFLAGARLLGEKLGALLLQCPPDFGPTPDNRAALSAFLEREGPHAIRLALELRDARWFDETLFALARRHRVTIAIAEGTHASLDLAARISDEISRDPPAEFAYVRWLGDRSITSFDRVRLDRTSSLDAWERMLRTLRTSVRDIYGYANNHYQGHSPATVRAVLARLGEPVPPETTSPRLF